MPKGGKSKPLDAHIQDGTYRQDRNGIMPARADYERLEDMKATLYNSFNKLSARLDNVDIDKTPDIYKSINTVMMEQIKTYFSISKYQVNKDDSKDENKKINISNFQ